ncbi:MAG: hypothetical protein GY777_07780 [Candidatus Brocadiaceae bacterium]|nr:hypothetical protein [Candidatus Brocadiaceae bacterium]
MNKIVLIEFIDEFEMFREFVHKNGLKLNEFTIVAIDCKLEAYLLNSGIDFRNPLNYLSDDYYKRILLKFEGIRTYIEENFDFTDENGLSCAYLTELQYFIELIFNYIAKVLEILQGIYNKDDRIELFACTTYHVSKSVVIEDDRFLGSIVEQFAKTKNIKFNSFGSFEISNNGSTSTKRRDGNSIISYMLFSIFKYYLKIFNKVTILIPTKTYGFNKLVYKIRRKYSNVVFISFFSKKGTKWYHRYVGIMMGLFSGHAYVDIDVIRSDVNLHERDILRNKIVTLFSNSASGDVFEYCGINFSNIMTDKIQVALTGHLSEMVSCSYRLQKFVELLDVKLLISPTGRGLWHIAGELLSKTGIPALFVSHGTHPVPTNQYHEISIFNSCRGFMLGSYSHIGLSTPVQEAHLHYFKDKYKCIQNQEIKMGPLIFANVNGTDKIKHRSKLHLLPDERVIIHAVSTGGRINQRYYFLETHEEIFSSLSDIVDVVDKNEKMRLIIRVHPGFYLTDDEIKILLPESNKFIINREGPFSEALAASDILISYSSTTIDEALLNRVPVLLYDKWNRYNHFQTGIYDNPQSPDIFPVCYVNNKDKLKGALDFILEKEDSVNKEDIDVARYKYRQDYEDNFYKFVEESLNQKGGY